MYVSNYECVVPHSRIRIFCAIRTFILLSILACLECFNSGCVCVHAMMGTSCNNGKMAQSRKNSAMTQIRAQRMSSAIQWNRHKKGCTLQN